MSRLYVLMEVVKTDAVDVDGNAVYHPVDGGRGELMWLRTDRIIECANSGPGYGFIDPGDIYIDDSGLIKTATKEINECDFLCFPTPEREERDCLTCGHNAKNEFPCGPCTEGGKRGNKKYTYWKPRAGVD